MDQQSLLFLTFYIHIAYKLFYVRISLARTVTIWSVQIPLKSRLYLSQRKILTDQLSAQ
jgi:hypothetical protein